MVKGVMGKILMINLNDRSSRVETVPEEVYRKYLSGLGLGVRLLYDRIPPGADALGPDNYLAFLGGVLTGTGTMFAGRFLVVGKSPLTGGWGDANCGGNLAPAIKGCGYDGIFFTGCADAPVIAYLHDEQVEILPAEDLWGKDTVETEDLLIQRFGSRVRVASIGPAGENLVRFASIANGHGRLAARSGLGAVMGSKKLKALVLDGRQRVEVADPAALKQQNKAIAALMPKGKSPIPGWSLGIIGWVMSHLPSRFRTDGLMSFPLYSEWGTATGNESSILSGDAPVRNWRGHPGLYPSWTVSASRFARTHRKKYHCVSCPLGCGNICTMSGRYQETHRPEYETVAAFGPNLLTRDLSKIYDLSEYCNRMGMDSISTGSVMAFAFECFEHGLIDREMTCNVDLKWGDGAAAAKLAEMIVHRQGVGDLLADGVRSAAEHLGEASQGFAFHAGGQELPMHDPRIDPAYGVLYVSDPTPGRHTVSSSLGYETLRLWTKVNWAPEPPQTYPKKRWYENSAENARSNAAGAMFKAVLDCAGLCLFGSLLGVDRLGIFELLNAATGFDFTPDEYMQIGKRVQDLRQAFNLRHGLQPASVTIPPLLFGKPAAKKGPARGIHFDLAEMQRSFWRAMGWDETTGNPPLEEEQGA